MCFNIPKKMRKVEVQRERLFCEIEAFLKKTIVSVTILKASKTSNFFLTKYKGKCEVLLYCTIEESDS